MAKSKYYVVWNGRKPGIYEGWDKCRDQVAGFTGAKFKGFLGPAKFLLALKIY